jgi:hypothetical protein
MVVPVLTGSVWLNKQKTSMVKDISWKADSCHLMKKLPASSVIDCLLPCSQNPTFELILSQPDPVQTLYFSKRYSIVSF